MDSKLFSHLRKKIEELRDTHAEVLIAGRASSFDDYRYTSGVIRGLALASDVITDLEKRLENSDE